MSSEVKTPKSHCVMRISWIDMVFGCLRLLDYPISKTDRWVMVSLKVDGLMVHGNWVLGIHFSRAGQPRVFEHFKLRRKRSPLRSQLRFLGQLHTFAAILDLGKPSIGPGQVPTHHTNPAEDICTVSTKLQSSHNLLEPFAMPERVRMPLTCRTFSLAFIAKPAKTAPGGRREFFCSEFSLCTSVELKLSLRASLARQTHA
jgi:hypothetical protein